MADVSFAPCTSSSRIYDFELPLRFPGFSIGMAISQMKQLGVWDEIPGALRRKIKQAKGLWSVLRITRADLNSIPDHAWGKIAKHLGLKWTYAGDPATARRPRSDAAAPEHQGSQATA